MDSWNEFVLAAGCLVGKLPDMAPWLGQFARGAMAWRSLGFWLGLSLAFTGDVSSRPQAAEVSKASSAPALKAPHWAFQPVTRPALPTFRSSKPVRSPLDAFVLARLEKEGLSLSSPADKTTLLRRLSLDLTGLPPTVAEVDAFLADKAPGAYERQVERLLASPHYGERWARHWLDAARYADSNGYEKDRAREMWHYRDWVVEAFNQDMPYDRFLLEQFAGDLLPNATQAQWIATGFLRNSMFNEEGAIDPEQFRMDALFDRMDALGKGVLGLTLSCGQCHSHKYDPLSQEEYYKIFAFLNDVDEYTAPVFSNEGLRQRDQVLKEVTDLERQLKHDHPDWSARLAEWEASVRDKEPAWMVLEAYEAGAPDGLSKLQPQKDGSLLAGGHRYQGGTWFFKARTKLAGITGVRLEVLTNGNLPMRGPGRSASGLFLLREFTLQAAPATNAAAWVKIPLTAPSTDFEQVQSPDGDPTKEKEKDFQGPVRFAIDGNGRTGWAIDAGPGLRNADRKAVFQVATNLGSASGVELKFELACGEEVGCFRIAVTTNAAPVADPLPRTVREVLALAPAQRSVAQQAAVFSYWRTTVPAFKEANARIAAAWARHPERTGETLTLAARPVSRPTFILKRGDWLQPAARVEPGVPAFLNPLPSGAEPPRLRFARWLADPKAPTTARVFVNRVWQSYFGAGLVTTSEDFGVQADKPSHPELLDWLAAEFMNPSSRIPGAGLTDTLGPWSVKHLHRLIVTSDTYRQSSRVPAALYERDPNNRLLARAPRLRVEGEIVRDVSLAASGLLNPVVGGPSVYSPAPAFLFVPPTSYMAFPWKDATGPDRYRRAFYTFRRRSTPYPMLQTFDTPNGDAACVRRVRSNTPLQALTTLNETLFIECAQSLARKMLEEGGSRDEARIVSGFRRVVSRTPSAREKRELLGLLERQRRHFGEGWVNAMDLAAGDGGVAASSTPKGATPTDWAAYTAVARVLLNLDEAITKE